MRKDSLHILVAALVTATVGCSTPKAVERHHHHYYEADTLAVQAQVDRHMKAWSERMQSEVTEAVSQQLTQQSQSEHQQETIQETVTVTIDSLGREIRQEQRTISRDITREQQLMEQRLSCVFESRLKSAIDSISDIWQSRIDSLRTHAVENDSSSVIQTPVAVHQDNRPWWKKAFGYLQAGIIGAAVALVIWYTRRWWMAILKNL